MPEKKKFDFKPFILTVILVLIDQLTKMLVIKNIPLNTIKYCLGDDFLWICHVRNTGAGFSLGASSSPFVRFVFFIIGPIAIIGLICWVIASQNDFLAKTQRWFAAGIVGGGIGTIIDRIFRFDEGVVDFISVKFYGIFGMDRWPTFNFSDSCVVVFVILFLISMFFGENKNGNK